MQYPIFLGRKISTVEPWIESFIKYGSFSIKKEFHKALFSVLSGPDTELTSFLRTPREPSVSIECLLIDNRNTDMPYKEEVSGFLNRVGNRNAENGIRNSYQIRLSSNYRENLASLRESDGVTVSLYLDEKCFIIIIENETTETIPTITSRVFSSGQQNNDVARRPIPRRLDCQQLIMTQLRSYCVPASRFIRFVGCMLSDAFPEEKHSSFYYRPQGLSEEILYLEHHHVIPFKYRRLFENEIDVEANITCLCPTCHRKIHHGLDEDRRKMVEALYALYAEQLQNCVLGREISCAELLKYYGLSEETDL